MTIECSRVFEHEEPLFHYTTTKLAAPGPRVRCSTRMNPQVLILFCWYHGSAGRQKLNDPLGHHCFGNLHKSTYIGPVHIIDKTIRFSSKVHTGLVDILHNGMKAAVNLFP